LLPANKRTCKKKKKSMAGEYENQITATSGKGGNQKKMGGGRPANTLVSYQIGPGTDLFVGGKGGRRLDLYPSGGLR